MQPELLEADALKEAACRRDRDRLQGAWNFVSGSREAQLLVAGDHYTVKFGNGDIYLGTFRLDPTGKPRTMDMHVDEGPERHRGKTALCIYEFDGDHLIWCPARIDAGERPRAFPPADDTTQLCVVFRRERPRPTAP